jgi:beta-glucosidase
MPFWIRGRFTALWAFAVIAAVAVTILSAALPVRGQTTPIFRNPNAPLEARVNDLFSRLTEQEKLSLLTGTYFTSQPIPRLGLDGIAMADAGQGVRGGMDSTQGPATLFPAGVTTGCSWDRALMRQIGQAIGDEARNKGTGVQIELGPAINIHRSPLGGRDSEYISEDPYLTGQMAAAYIQGMQSTGVGACVKHFDANNEEVDRGEVNVVVSERALREIYLPAFEAAVKLGHARAVMSSYNRVNGAHSSANWYLLTDILRTCWGFDGLVMSDWGGVHETAGAINAGNDLEMPGPGLLSYDHVKQALDSGQITQGAIDSNVRDILRAMIRSGLADPVRHIPDHAVVGSRAHQDLAYTAATEGMVLLKNQDGLLPLDASRVRSIALIGPRVTSWQMGADGSPGVEPTTAVTVYDGIKQRCGNSIALSCSDGYPIATPVPSDALTPSSGAGNGLLGAYFANPNLAGSPTAVRVDPLIQFGDWNDRERPAGIPHENFSVRWTGKLVAPATGDTTFEVDADDGCRLIIDGNTIIDNWRESAGAPVRGHAMLVAGQSYAIRIEYFQARGAASTHFNWALPTDDRFGDAVKLAKAADVAIVCVGSEHETEGVDRQSMDLPGSQDDIVRAVAAANPRTIVVLNNGGPVLMSSWIDGASAVVEAGFPGEMGGKALAAVLFGDVDPSGKLTDTVGLRREDYPDYGHFPGVNNVVHYTEGIYVGYRAFDKRRITPLFPFGYGLSYTRFRYGHVSLSSATMDQERGVTVAVPITNTGARAGAEIAELYMEPIDPAQPDRPIRELKGFDRLDLSPGQTGVARFTVTPRDLAYCDVPGKRWRADAGRYWIEVGASSRDLRGKALLTLARTRTQAIAGMGETDPFAPKPSLAVGKPAAASSTQYSATDPSEYAASKAVDGNPNTRWSSEFSDPQWIAVDLGKPTTISRVVLGWENAYAASYRIEVSNDGVTWTPVFSTTAGHGAVEEIRFQPVQARYVRMFGVARATEFGYSLYSFDVYAK